jgi:hypothetical protein
VAKDKSWVEIRLAVMRIGKYEVDILVTLNTPINDNNCELDAVFKSIVDSMEY